MISSDKTTASKSTILLISQRFYGVGSGRLDGLIADRQPRNNDRGQPAENKPHGVQCDPVGEAGKPLIREVPPDQSRGNKSDDDQARKLLRQNNNEVKGACAESLPYPDFFGTLFGSEGGQRK